MNLKFIGGILLIVGTSIGGGMLALPVVNAATGFWQSTLFLGICWLMMTLGALFILEANLYLPSGKHMISMAESTLGKPGLLVAWISYIFLLYTLLSAYISGGSDLFQSLIAKLGLNLSSWQSATLFTLIFGAVVYGGIRRVDLVNRALMFAKLGVYLLLIVLIAPHVQLNHFEEGNARYILGTVMVLITSFGYAIIVPNLREYFNDDLPTLRKILWIGSLIPLFCYIAWDAVIMGTVPLHGENGLISLMESAQPTSQLSNIVSLSTQNKIITTFFNFFTSICMLTAFLGVALCLISFLADGFKTEQKGKAGLLLFVLTFLPPLILVLYYPGAYIHALNYAGIFCVILLLLLPALMTLAGRRKFKPRYQVPGGLITQLAVVLFSFVLLINALYELI